jgi:4-diphosphocytidyl-2-C-methyl-D-erythritol kinase
MLKRLAPAKINLVLEVLGKRDDGYHEISSLVQTVDLCDVIIFELASVVSLECSEPSLQTWDNLVVKAAELLREASGFSSGARIKLEKRIPWGSGLGGGSSDAAATLLALNQLWELKLTTVDLVELAAKLGSDVPFFIHGGVALMQGRGEKITPLPDLAPMWYVLLVPPLPKMPNKTQQLYSLLETRRFSDGQLVERAVKSWSRDKQINSSQFYNVFDGMAFGAFPGLEAYWRRFAEAGAEDIHLAGSGPALFTSAHRKAKAEKIYRGLLERGLEAYALSTMIKIAT